MKGRKWIKATRKYGSVLVAGGLVLGYAVARIPQLTWVWGLVGIGYVGVSIYLIQKESA